MLIYKIINKVSGTIYIGQTQNSLERRWSSHISLANKNNRKTPLLDAIKSYGKDNFDIKVLVHCDSIEQMNHREIYYIKLFNSLVPNGYNLDSGGKNKIMHQSTKDKLSKARTGKKMGPHSKEHREKLSKIHSGRKYPNRIVSEETRIKLSVATSGENNSMFGKNHTETTKKKCSEVNTGNTYWLGRKHSEESKNKLSKSKDHLKKSVICIETNQTFASIREAAKTLSIHKPQISGVLSGKYKTAKGLTFKRVA